MPDKGGSPETEEAEELRRREWLKFLRKDGKGVMCELLRGLGGGGWLEGENHKVRLKMKRQKR